MSAAVRAIRPAPQTAPNYLSPEQVIVKLPGVTVDQLERWRKEGKGPAYIKPAGYRGAATLYLESDVDAFMAAKRIATREQS